MDHVQHVHFVGIGGYGMSAIARVLLDLGYKVTGSDVTASELTKKLEQRGAKVMIGHDASHLDGAEIVVYSTSITSDNPEITAAAALGIPVLHRSKMLAQILNQRTGIAVAGAHGKTTTSSMIAHIMEESGVDPTFIIGGEMMNAGTNAKAGKSDYVIAEADESDGSFLEYRPSIAVITNIEADHLEHFNGDFANLKAAYKTYLSHIKPGGKAILCLDDEYIRELLPSVQHEVISYALSAELFSQSDYAATEIVCGDGKTSCQVWYKQQPLGELVLHFPGTHNVANALAAIAVCRHLDLSFDQIASALATFRGAKRRFQVIGQRDDILIVDDYAHHPTEIKATLNGARAFGKRIIAVFQPQRYTRTYFLMDEFSRAFGDADEVIITDIYSPPGEARIEGVSSQVLVEKIRQNSNSNTRYIPSKEAVQEYLLTQLRPGDLVLTMGAGDIWRTAKWLTQQLVR